MVTVYFETNGYAEKYITFRSEEVYMQCFLTLERIAKANGFLRVTESMDDE